MRSYKTLLQAILLASLTLSAQATAPRDEFTSDFDFKCFTSNEELRAAVQRYERYNIVDMDLANEYGWPIGHWCVKGLQDFSAVFEDKTDFNEDISMWDVSSATSLRALFQNALAFQGDRIGMWDTSNVEDMSFLFHGAKAFNAQSIAFWDVTSVTEMNYMFAHALAFGQDLLPWKL
jgi:hypothetical protein